MPGIVSRRGMGSGMTGTQPPVGRRAAVKATAKFEIGFLTKMIDHHQMGVDMARMCAREAVHAPLRDMARKISAAQTAEIKMMQGWLADWYDKSHEPMTTKDMKAEMKRLGSLRGAEFEKAFMKSMIPHHSQAIADAKKALERGSHDDLLVVCREVIEKQGEEISQMRTWLCEWHKVCGDSVSRRASS